MQRVQRVLWSVGPVISPLAYRLARRMSSSRTPVASPVVQVPPVAVAARVDWPPLSNANSVWVSTKVAKTFYLLRDIDLQGLVYRENVVSNPTVVSAPTSVRYYRVKDILDRVSVRFGSLDDIKREKERLNRKGVATADNHAEDTPAFTAPLAAASGTSVAGAAAGTPVADPPSVSPSQSFIPKPTTVSPTPIFPVFLSFRTVASSFVKNFTVWLHFRNPFRRLSALAWWRRHEGHDSISSPVSPPTMLRDILRPMFSTVTAAISNNILFFIRYVQGHATTQTDVPNDYSASFTKPRLPPSHAHATYLGNNAALSVGLGGNVAILVLKVCECGG
jgi:hypothetical protein